MICITLVLSSCKKDKLEADYRDKWVGDWDFVVERISYTGWFTEHDTVFYSGIITIGNSDTTLNIRYYKNTLLEDILVDKFGKLDKLLYRPFIQGQFEGKENVYIEYKNHNSSNLGDTHIINGTKKKGARWCGFAIRAFCYC